MAPTRTLQRGLVVLETLAAGASDAGMTVTDIAAATGLDKATTMRLLQTLCSCGYAYQDTATRMYRLTGKLTRLASAHHATLDLPRRAESALLDLRDAVGETVHLGVLQDDHVVYIAKFEAPQPVQIASAVGQVNPVHTTALGRAILSASPPGLVEELLARIDLTPRTSRTLKTRSALRAEIKQTAVRGYSIDDRENEDHITCVGAPLVPSSGIALAAISISGPTFRMDDKLERLGKTCRHYADVISKGL